MRFHHRAAGMASGLLLLAISGCATADLETCDPNAVADLGTSLACDKYFKQRIANLEQRIREIEAATAQELAAASVAQSEADRLAGQVRAESEAVNAIELEVARLNLQLSSMRRQNEADQLIVDAARRQVADAQRQLAEAKNNGPTVAQVEELRTMISTKKKAIEAFGTLFEEQI